MQSDDPNALRRVYFALIAGTIGYGVIAYIATQGSSSGTIRDLMRNPIVIPLYAAAVFAYLLSFVVPAALARAGQPARVYYIARWAMIESSAVFGLVASITVHDVRLFIAPWLLTMIGLARAYPSLDARP